jgi:hypothetical protein
VAYKNIDTDNICSQLACRWMSRSVFGLVLEIP